jgi:hypothetical protein
VQRHRLGHRGQAAGLAHQAVKFLDVGQVLEQAPSAGVRDEVGEGSQRRVLPAVLRR